MNHPWVVRLVLTLITTAVSLPAAAREEPTYEGKPACAWAFLLKDKDPDVRFQAAFALHALGADAAAEASALIAALRDPSEDVRRMAAQALGISGTRHKAVLPALVAALTAREADVRASAAEALSSFGAEARPSQP
jgi:HEAT repeat protein